MARISLDFVSGTVRLIGHVVTICFIEQIAPEQLGPTLLPHQIRERCYEEAATIVDVTNHSSGSPQVSSPAILDLITKLTSLMLQMKVCVRPQLLCSHYLTVGEKNGYTPKVIDGDEAFVRYHLITSL